MSWKVGAVLCSLVFLAACQSPPPPQASAPPTPAVAPEPDARILEDFETPLSTLRWSGSHGHLSRSSLSPLEGLWALELKEATNGDLQQTFDALDLSGDWDTLEIPLRLMSPHKTPLSAAITLEDRQGHRWTGDTYTISRQWLSIPLDLRDVQGLDRKAIGKIRLAIMNTTQPVTLQSDGWKVSRHRKVLENHPDFQVTWTGRQLEVSRPGEFSWVFHQRSGTQRPWVTLSDRQGMILGQPGTGCLLLDQTPLDRLALSTQPPQKALSAATAAADLGEKKLTGWPRTEAQPWSEWTWQCGWHSPLACQVEVKESAGTLDTLGRPSVQILWRWMIYRNGRIYLHVTWQFGSDLWVSSRPVSLALALAPESFRPATGPATGSDLASEAYQALWGPGVSPEKIQRSSPLGLVLKPLPEGEAFWWADQGSRRYLGVGIPSEQRDGPIDALLVVGDAEPRRRAEAFWQHLQPPAWQLRRGTLETIFPGDRDNDTLVEPSGFQVLRLVNGSLQGVLNPQGRRLDHPVILIAGDAENSDGLMVNVEGDLLETHLRWPDGSWLLELPYQLERPVSLEVVRRPGGTP